MQLSEHEEYDNQRRKPHHRVSSFVQRGGPESQDGALVHAEMVWRTRLNVKWCPGPKGMVPTRKVLPAHPGSYGTGVKRGLKNTTTSQSR
jgi:hypothetical protein